MMQHDNAQATATCPTQLIAGDRIQLAHGEGGRLMRQLLMERIAPHLGLNPAWDDAARCTVAASQLAVSTDSFVVSPLFFPGGDIGSLAVYGTVNDLAVSGAQPLWLTLSLILEEGLPLETLDRILISLRAAATECEVAIIAGDTKVVPHGAVDKIFVNTTGVGQVRQPGSLGCARIQEADALIVSGSLAHHGIAVLAAREQLQLSPAPRSDSAPLHRVCQRLQQTLGEQLHAMRDATRGGLSAVMHEWAQSTGKTMRLFENRIPVTAGIRGACELLGLDPIYVANEGVFVAAVDASVAEQAIATLQQECGCPEARIVGEVIRQQQTPVIIQRLMGNWQSLDEPSGAPLPRIC